MKNLLISILFVLFVLISCGADGPACETDSEVGCGERNGNIDDVDIYADTENTDDSTNSINEVEK